MEQAKDRPTKDGPTGPAEPAPSAAPRDDVLARASPVRCPFCHEGVGVADEQWVACRGCLARHHAGCWSEAGACAACGGKAALSEGAAGITGTGRSRGSRLAVRVAGVCLVVVVMGLVRMLRGPRGSEPEPAAATWVVPGGRYADAIQAASTLSNPHDMADALVRVVLRPDVTTEDLQSVLRLAPRISRSADRLTLLRGLKARPGGLAALTEAEQAAWVEVAFGLPGGADQATALIELLQSGRVHPGVRARIVKDVSKVAYSADRKRVVDALTESTPR